MEGSLAYPPHPAHATNPTVPSHQSSSFGIDNILMNNGAAVGHYNGGGYITAGSNNTNVSNGYTIVLGANEYYIVFIDCMYIYIRRPALVP